LRGQKYTQIFVRNPEGREYLEDLDVGGRMILKLISMKQYDYAMDWINVVEDRNV
jgi:hypothetical protein